MKSTNYILFATLLLSGINHAPAIKAMEKTINQEKTTVYINNETDTDIYVYTGEATLIKASSFVELQLSPELISLGFSYNEDLSQPNFINMQAVYSSKKRNRNEKQTLDILLTGSSKEDIKTSEQPYIKAFHNWITSEKKAQPEATFLKDMKTHSEILTKTKTSLSVDIEHSIAVDMMRPLLPYLMKERYIPTVFELDQQETGTTISNDKTQLAIYSKTTCFIRNLKNEKLSVQLDECTNDDIYSATFSPDGATLLVCDWSDNFSLWNTTTGKKIKELNLPPSIWHASNAVFSKDGTICATRGEKTLTVWDTETWEKLLTLERQHIASIALSPNGKFLAIGSYEGNLEVIHTKTSDRYAILPGHPSITFLEFSPNGKLLASSDRKGTILLWNIETKEQQQSLKYSKNCAVQKVAFTNNMKDPRLASYYEDNTVKLWDVSSGKELETIGIAKTAIQLAFSSDDKKLYNVSYHHLYCWDFSNDPVGHWLKHDITLPEAILIDKAYAKQRAGDSLILRKQNTNSEGEETQDYEILIKLREKKPRIAQHLIDKLDIKLID